jgi:predicted dehydrogenase
MPEKYLIVSLGSIGRRHLSNLRCLRPDAQIGVLRLHSSVAAGDMPDGADVQFSSIQAAIDFGPQAAIIAGPSSTHLAVASHLAGADVALFIEKPIADKIDGLADLLEQCTRKKLPVMTGYNLRFLPSLMEAKRIVGSGMLGDVLSVRAEVGQYLPDWRPASRYQETVSAQSALGGGVLLELSHEIDYLYWMFGLPDWVTARGGRYSSLDIDVEDVAEICLEYANPKRLVSIHLDFLQRAPMRGCKFIGTRGTLIWNGITDSLDLYRDTEARWEHIDTFAMADRNSMYMDELSHFLDCVATKKHPLIDGYQGRDVLAVAEAAKHSISSSGTVKVKAHAAS